MAFFALVYIVEGLGQTGGLIAQPLNYFLKEQYGWSPVQVTAYLTVFNFPWIIKPVYGLVSDFVPPVALNVPGWSHSAFQPEKTEYANP